MRILHFADLHLGVESYGHPDPASGLSTRMGDILAALDALVEYAITERVDLVLFCGDAYKNREPSQTQQREFAKRILRMSEAGVPIFILTGNHDLPNAAGRATSTEIFATLAVKNVYVSTRPDVYQIPTRSGIIQVASLPWLRRSVLLGREDTRGLNFDQINERMQAALNGLIAAHVTRLDPSLPAVLAAHVWVAGARLGTEKMMTIGQEHTLLPSAVGSPAFDYVALGHIHRGQSLGENPPVVYSGSLTRLDFGDEDQEKGFRIVEIDTAAQPRRVTHRLHPVASRRFLTISVTLAAEDADPMSTVLRAVAARADEVKDAIVRLQIAMPAGLQAQVNDTELRNALKDAHFLNIAREVQRESRARIGKWSAEETTPLDALRLWLETKNTPPQRMETLLDYGRKLIEEQAEK